MIKKKKNIKLLQAAFFIGCLFVLGCENRAEDINAQSAPRNLAEEAVNVQVLMSQSGNPRALLKSPFMIRYSADTSYVEFPRSLKVDFFDSSGKVESHLSALYGKHFETRNMVYLKDSVLVVNIKGDTLRTAELWWDQNTQKFFTEKNVHVRQKDKNIYGKGLEANQDLTRLAIFKITGIFYIPEDGGGF